MADQPPLPLAMRRISSNLLEVKVDAAVELTQQDVRSAHAWLTRMAEGKPVAVLVVKTNQYSYTFDAMKGVLNHPLIFALAYHLASEAQRPSVETLLAVSENPRRFPVEVFTSRGEALDWLVRQGAVRP